MRNDKKLVFNTLRLIKKNCIDIRYCDLYNNGEFTEFGTIVCAFTLISVFTVVFKCLEKSNTKVLKK